MSRKIMEKEGGGRKNDAASASAIPITSISRSPENGGVPFYDRGTIVTFVVFAAAAAVSFLFRTKFDLRTNADSRTTPLAFTFFYCRQRFAPLAKEENAGFASKIYRNLQICNREGHVLHVCGEEEESCIEIKPPALGAYQGRLRACLTFPVN